MRCVNSGHPPSLLAWSFTVNKVVRFKKKFLRKMLVWDDKIGSGCYFVGLHALRMINRDSWGYSNPHVRGEILGFWGVEQLRRHLPRMFSLIKNES